MSTELASAISHAHVGRGLLLVAAGLLAIACGGEATSSRGNTHDGGSGGESPGDGGTSSSGGAPSTGGESGSGGEQMGGAGGVLDNGCSLTTMECIEGWCSCGGVFEQCPVSNVHCDADAEGIPYNCECGAPSVGVRDCEYSLQFRCDPPLASDWVRICTCDPVYPTDEEPCRYHQAMYDAAGEDRVCTMFVADIEPTEEWKYYCSCLVPEDG